MTDDRIAEIQGSADEDWCNDWDDPITDSRYLLAEVSRLREQVAQLELENGWNDFACRGNQRLLMAAEATIARVEAVADKWAKAGTVMPIADVYEALRSVGVVGGEATPTETPETIAEPHHFLLYKHGTGQIEGQHATGQEAIAAADREGSGTYDVFAVYKLSDDELAVIMDSPPCSVAVFPAAVPVPAETPETKLLRDIFTDPAQRPQEVPGRVAAEWDNAEDAVYDGEPELVLPHRFAPWKHNSVACGVWGCAAGESDPIHGGDYPGGHRIDDEGDQNR